MQWEYKIEDKIGNLDYREREQHQTQLNNLGNAGWELVAAIGFGAGVNVSGTVYIRYIFRRSKG